MLKLKGAFPKHQRGKTGLLGQSGHIKTSSFLFLCVEYYSIKNPGISLKSKYLLSKQRQFSTCYKTGTFEMTHLQSHELTNEDQFRIQKFPSKIQFKDLYYT